MKKRVLCFGDSLTWGFNPDDCSRFDEGIRWTSILQDLLGEDYKVIEEGQNGRVIAKDDPLEGEKNALKYVAPCMESQCPLDIMVVMLGTNDIKTRFNHTAQDIADEMELLLIKIKSFADVMLGGKLRVILMAPPHFPDNMMNSPFGESFGFEEGQKLSYQLAEVYEKLAEKFGIEFIDTSKYLKVSLVDSVHLEQNQQPILAKLVADQILL